MTLAAGRGDTRAQLLDAAERLMAVDGVQGVATRDIVEAAQQRNPSAISYHFGSREALLLAVLARRGAPIDDERGSRRAVLATAPDLRDLVACLVVPYAALLETEAGRAYLRIVAQLRGRFAVWRVESDQVTTQHLASILDEIEGQLTAPPEIVRERVVALMLLLTGSTAERARRADEAVGDELDHDRFVDGLIAMCTAVLDA